METKKKYQRVRVKIREDGFYYIYTTENGSEHVRSRYYFKYFALKAAKELSELSVLIPKTIWDSNSDEQIHVEQFLEK